jgi:dihydroorotase
VEEVLGYSRETGAPLHIVHVNSSGGRLVREYLDVIQKARDNGVDVTTECYPYNRGSTFIQSHLFDDWETYSDEDFAQYIWVETGEQLTRETFGKYRQQGGIIISPPTYSMDDVKVAVTSPLTMIASDGMWLDKGRAHPRTFGTYTRILGRYVREEKALSLMDALAKMSLRPAQRLEPRVPDMKNKGRVKIGADADLAVFNPDTVLDTGTFEDPAQHPAGIRHVVVNGVAVLVDGKLVEGQLPGRAIRAPIKQ